MITFNPNSLYCRADLIQMLEGTGVDADTFIARLKPRKVFRMMWFGEDILSALKSATSLSEHMDKAPAESQKRVRQKRAIPVEENRPGRKIDEYLKALRKEEMS